MKQEILDIAMNQMMAGGYEALSFRRIAEDLTISKANVHHHFKNKESLALEVTREFANAQFEGIQAMAHQFRGDLLGFGQAIEAYFWDTCRTSGHCSVCVCDQVMRDLNSPESLRLLAEEHFERFNKMLFELVTSSIESKQLRSDLDPQTTTIHLGMMMNGMKNMAQGFSSLDQAEQQLGGQLQKWIQSLKV